MRSILSLPLLAASTLLLYGASATPVLHAREPGARVMPRAPMSTEYLRPFPVDKNQCAVFAKAGTIEGGGPSNIDGALVIDVQSFYHVSADGSTSSILLPDSGTQGGIAINITFGGLDEDIVITGTAVTSEPTGLKVRDALFQANANNSFTQYKLRLRIRYVDPNNNAHGKYRFIFFYSNEVLTPGGEKKKVVKLDRADSAVSGKLFSIGICLQNNNGDGNLGCGLSVTPRGAIGTD
ncbi:hypothetical protein TWF696_001062 [Orbilia brochopaga]|uniref:Uncharacterized protein n=1 Tax=Orbilia brochopaga TaxID=3140254 RepID=A0AAV9VFL5_9PEZI